MSTVSVINMKEFMGPCLDWCRRTIVEGDHNYRIVEATLARLCSKQITYSVFVDDLRYEERNVGI